MTTNSDGWTFDKHGSERYNTSYPFVDEKGREVGGYALVFRCGSNYVESYRGKFLVCICATRDGKRYGASQHGKAYPTLAEAKAEAIKGLAAQCKRYAKKYGAK